MAAIGNLPTEILIQIFSYLKTYELLSAEKVSQHWNGLICQYVWTQRTCISKDAVGYPREGFFENFIEIVHRVGRVSVFFGVLAPMYGVARSNPQLMGKLKQAVAKLLSKRTPNVVFPLHLISDLLFYATPKKYDDLLPSEVTATANQLICDLQMNSFDAILLKELNLHESSSRCDPFLIYHRHSSHELPLNTTQLTKLYIHSLSLPIDRGATSTGLVVTLMNHLSTFNHLESIEIKNFNAVIISEDEHNYNSVGINIALSFHPNGCVFSKDDFLSLLMSRNVYSETTSTEKILGLIEHWKETNAVKKGKLDVHSSEYERMTSLIWARNDPKEAAEYDGNCVEKVISSVFPSLTDELHLCISEYNVYDFDAKILFQAEGLFSRLRRFHVSFADEIRRDRKDDMGWCEPDAVQIVRDIVENIAEHMYNLQSLELILSYKGFTCPPSIFALNACVTTSLPRLETLRYDGYLAFPFIISAVKQAPHLRELTINSQPFEHERTGLQWIKKLVGALADKKYLRFLLIFVETRKRPWKYSISREDHKERAKILKASSDVLRDIKTHLDQLVSSLPWLKHATVCMSYYKLKFCFDKSCPGGKGKIANDDDDNNDDDGFNDYCHDGGGDSEGDGGSQNGGDTQEGEEIQEK